MSEATLPHLIEPGKWADRCAELKLRLPLARFTRLLQGAQGGDGEVVVDCRFERDVRGLPHLRGRIATELQMTCQRCLAPVAMPLAAEVDVWLLSDEAQAERLSEEEDYTVFEDGHLDLPELLEDELILALPLVARHEDCEPQAAMTEDEPVVAPVEKENPFSILARLKQPDAE